MSKARTVRFDDDIDPLVDHFVEKNDINFNRLMNLAVKEFISKPHTIELEPVNEAEWDRLMKKSHKKYKKTLDELAK
jgi:predicted transcriptional regulator